MARSEIEGRRVIFYGQGHMAIDTRPHTRGPWHLDPEGYCEYIWGPDGEMIAMMRGAGTLPIGANARLIAEAPALLLVLKQALRDSGCDGDLCAHDWHEEARRVIAEVEGR